VLYAFSTLYVEGILALYRYPSTLMLSVKSGNVTHKTEEYLASIHDCQEVLVSYR